MAYMAFICDSFGYIYETIYLILANILMFRLLRFSFSSIKICHD